MARFTGGWIKVHRSVLEHWVGEDIDTLGFFVRLLALANIKDSKHVRHGNFISVKRGDILTSSLELAVSTGRSRCWVEKRLDLLENDGTIKQQKSNAGRVITICNYNDYQDNDKEEKQQTLQQKSSPEAAPRQPRGSPETHSKEGKNNKKVRKKEVISIPSTVVEAEIVLPDQNLIYYPIAKEWLEFAQKEMPWNKSQNWTTDAFGLELERISRIMNLNLHGLEAILKFVQKDEFWRKNAVSPFGLLTKSSRNGNRKIDNLLVNMRTKQSRTDEALQRFATSTEPFEDPFKC